MFDSLKEKVSSPFSSDEQDEESEEPEAENEPSEETQTDESEETEAISTGAKAKSLLKGKRVLDEDELEEHLEEFELTLIQNDVAMEVAEAITDQVKHELKGEKQTIGRSSAPQVKEALQNAIQKTIQQSHDDLLTQIETSEKPFTIIFTGINGVGKTTTIAKLSHYLEQQGYSTVLANGDTYRAGAEQQIQKHADNLGTKLIKHEQGGDPTAVIYDAVEYAEANDVDVVLGDTAGRLHTSNDLMEQLSKINRVVDPDMNIFVDESVAGQDAINRAEEFNNAAEINGIILTKADADEKGGSILSIPYVTNTPIYFLGNGQSYSDLTKFDPEAIATQLVNEN